MEKFDFNGRSYKVVNGLAHNADTAILHPVYKGDNVLLDAYCKELGVELYNRPSGTHAYGNQSGKRSTVQVIEVDYDAAEKNAVKGKCPTAEAVGLREFFVDHPVHVFGPDDVFTCPQCSSRVDFDELDDGCFCYCKCGYEFIAETGYDCPECGSTNTELEPMPVEPEYTCLDCGFVFVVDDI